jgi:hypothetical protein
MGRMKQLYIEVEELAASLLMDLGLEPGTEAYDTVYPGVRDRLTQWVDTTFLGASFPTEIQKTMNVLHKSFDQTGQGSWEVMD